MSTKSVFPLCHQVAALLPCYTPQGDSVTIIKVDGTQTTVNSNIRTVLRGLARNQSIDLVELRRKSKKATNRMILQPLPLAPGLLLIPLKTRQPKVAGDSATGYVNFHTIQKVIPGGPAPVLSFIKLTSGTTIPVLWGTATVNQLLTLAPLSTLPLYETAAAIYSPDITAAYPQLLAADNPKVQRMSRKLAEFFFEFML